MAKEDLYSWVTSQEGEETRRAFEYHVHPKIATTLNEHTKIADVGTGTGIWLTDLAKSLPQTCEFHGFDISDEQYPPTDKLPANVKLHKHNVLKPFPEHFSGQFDLVHIRLLVAVLREAHNWKQALDNVLQLLKPAAEDGTPGGALQWTEVNFMHYATPLRGRHDGSVAAMTRSFALISKLNGQHAFNDFAKLPFMFEDAGLRGVGVDIVSSDRVAEDRKSFSEQAVSVMPRLWKSARMYELPGALSETESEELQEELLIEIESGSYCRSDLHTVIGCK